MRSGSTSDDPAHMTYSERRVDGALVSLGIGHENAPSVSHLFQDEIFSHKEHSWNAPNLLLVTPGWVPPNASDSSVGGAL